MFVTVEDISASLHTEVRDLLARYSRAIIMEHCLTAESIIESNLSRRYHIRPELEKTGQERHKLLLQIGRDIAIYLLYHLSENIPNIRVLRYQEAKELLVRIAKGEAALPGVPAAPDPEAGTPDSDAVGYGSRKPRPPLFH